MMNPLVAQLDCFDEQWAKRRWVSFWVEDRKAAVEKTREYLMVLDADDLMGLLQELRRRALVALNFRGFWFIGSAALLFQLEFYALVRRCLELDKSTHGHIEGIAVEGKAPEIITFLKGGTIR